MKRGYQKAIITASAAIAISVLCTGYAFAYSTSQGTQGQDATRTSFQMSSVNFNWVGGIFNDLSGSFQGFMKSMGISSNKNTPINTSMNTAAGNTSLNIGGQGTTLEGIVQGFDAWFYGIAKFHISGIFDAILGVIIWVLDLAKSLINWILSLIH